MDNNQNMNNGYNNPNMNNGYYNNQNMNMNQQPVKKTNGCAIAGFILSFFTTIISLILCIVGLVSSKKCNSGKGLAIAGIIINILKVLLTILLIASGVALFSFIAPTVERAAMCAQAYDCVDSDEAGTKICKYKNENDEEQEIECESEYVENTSEINSIINSVIAPQVTKVDTQTNLNYTFEKYTIGILGNGEENLEGNFKVETKREDTSSANYNVTYTYNDKEILTDTYTTLMGNYYVVKTNGEAKYIVFVIQSIPETYDTTTPVVKVYTMDGTLYKEYYANIANGEEEYHFSSVNTLMEFTYTDDSENQDVYTTSDSETGEPFTKFEQK